MKIQLSDHFTYRKLFKFVAPSVVMMFFTVIYGLVNGLAVSNLVGKTAFAAINLIIPFSSIMAAFGFLFGSGGAALIAKALGEGNTKRADGLFTFMLITTVISGFVLSLLGQLFLPFAAQAMGAEGDLLDKGLVYGRMSLLFIPALMLQYFNQYMFPTAEKSKLGMYFTVIGGLSNILFVILFVGILDMCVLGAGLANGVSQTIGGICPLFYFFSKRNDSALHITKPIFNLKDFLQTCVNGSSELVINLSIYIIGILFNYQLLRLNGENGVAAFGVIMYINMIFISFFNGYSIGSSPIVAYNNGAGNHEELKNLLKMSLRIVLCLQAAMTISAVLLARPLSMLFVSYDKELLDFTTRAFQLYSISFLFMGINIYGSAFFTALNNGTISALISFLRTLVFQSAAVLLLPLVLDANGIWLSVTVAEILALFVTVICIIRNRNKYNYV